VRYCAAISEERLSHIRTRRQLFVVSHICRVIQTGFQTVKNLYILAYVTNRMQGMGKFYACSFASDSDAPSMTGWIALNWTGSLYNLLQLYSFVCIRME